MPPDQGLPNDELYVGPDQRPTESRKRCSIDPFLYAVDQQHAGRQHQTGSETARGELLPMAPDVPRRAFALTESPAAPLSAMKNSAEAFSPDFK